MVNNKEDVWLDLKAKILLVFLILLIISTNITEFFLISTIKDMTLTGFYTFEFSYGLCPLILLLVFLDGIIKI